MEKRKSALHLLSKSSVKSSNILHHPPPDEYKNIYVQKILGSDALYLEEFEYNLNHDKSRFF